jgi:resuscitation-promoting factor RpfA
MLYESKCKQTKGLEAKPMRIARRVLSPFVVLAAFYGGYRLLQWATADAWSVIDSVRAGSPRFDDLLFLVVAVLVWACFAWLALGGLLTFLSELPGAVGSACGAVAEKVTPAAYRNVAKIALGISVAAGPLMGALPANAAPVDNPAQAAAAAQLPSLDRPSSTGTSLPAAAQLPSLDRPAGAPVVGPEANLPMPDRPQSSNPSGTLPSPDRPSAEQTGAGNQAQQAQQRQQQAGQHVVKRGDTLWDIAASQLPAGASAQEITNEWHRWYQANKDVIGEDPNLILPGQVLQAPPDSGGGR